MSQLILFIILLLLLFISSSFLTRRLYICVSGMFLLLLASLRSRWVGVDTPGYHLMYNLLQTDAVTEVSTHMEKGFLYFNKFLLFFSGDSQLLFFISSAIMLGAVFYCFYKYSRFIGLSVFLYATDYYFFHLTGMRQGLAMAILLFSVPFIKQKKWGWFMALVFLASTFHSSALLFLIFYPLSKRPCNAKTVGISLLVAIFCIGLFPSFSNLMFKLFPTYLSYSESVWFGNEVKLASIMKILVAVIVFLFSWFTWRNISRERQEENKLFVHASLIGLCIMLISVRATLLEREAIYFSFFNTILLPNMLVYHTVKIRAILILAIIILFSLYTIITVVYRPDWYGVIPYTFFWEN